MTNYASASEGFSNGMRLGLMAREKDFAEDQNRRANEQHDMNMRQGEVRMNTEMLNQEIAKRSAELAKTDAGIKQMKMLAGGYGALMDAAANGKPVPPEATEALNQGLDAILGPMVNRTGPAHLDQKISQLEMGPGGATVILSNTDKKTGETYEAPMTVNRQAGEKQAAIIPGDALMGGMRTMIQAAVQGGVDPRILINAMEGGQQWKDEVNAAGIHGQRNTVTGKFDEGREPRESVGERVASALAVEEAKLGWQEKNAGRIAGIDFAKQERDITNKKKLNDKYPELKTAADLNERMDLFNKGVADIRKKVGTKDPMTGEVYDGSMADDSIMRMSHELGVYDQVKDRLPGVNLSVAEQEQATADAAARVKEAGGMWTSEEDLKQFGGAKTKADAIRFQEEKSLSDALDQKRIGMGLPALQQGKAPPASNNIAEPKSKAEYDALPSGARYIKNGQVKVKG